MAWVRIDDQFFFKPRTRAAGKEGRALFVAGLCYCAANLTDGRIDKTALPLVTAMAEVRPPVAKRLVEIGLWNDHGDHLEVIDYLEFHPTRAQVLTDREAAAERQRLSRERRGSQKPSQRDTERDTERDTGRDSPSDNGVSSRAPSPSPSPSPKTTPTSSSSSDDELPTGLWKTFADKKARAQNNVRNPTVWKAKVAANAQEELTDRALELYRRYDLTKSQLVDCLLSDTNPPWITGLIRRDTA